MIDENEMRSVISIQLLRNLRRLDITRSLASQARTLDAWNELLQQESFELAQAIHDKDRASIVDEAGDVLGNAMSLIFALEASGISMKEIVESQTQKYQNRKAHIFDGYNGKKPQSIEEENIDWQWAKTAEQLKTSS